jgi:CheY-like chemotaxis protein/HPt (histidine-containing phosphotransfer) domain-containing protein
MGLPRVLLVEDDASIRRFVSLALEDEAIELLQAPTLAAAIEALRGDPFALALCDLMLPDGSGLDLLRELASPGAPSPGARRVAFSAGISAPLMRQLEQAGVHDVLHKPASLADLLACLERALNAAPPVASQVAPLAAPAPSSAADPGAVHTYFGGDQALHDAYLAQCRAQFARDASAGDLAQAQADLPALRRLAHSLKSVWRSLGFAQDATLAARLEDSAAHGDAAASAALWPQVRGRLLGHASPAPEGQA